jgi:signal transduction histidine kinase
MKRPLLRSLQHKLLAIVLMTTMAAVVVALGAMIAYQLRSYHRDLVSDVTTQADLLGRTTAPALIFDDAKVAAENLGLLRYRPQVGAAVIYNAKGARFAVFARDDSERTFPKLPEADGTRIEGHDLIAFKRIVDNGEILGTVYVRADYALYDRLTGYLFIAASVLVLAMLVAFALSAILQRLVTRPLLAVSEIARQVMETRDYSRRAQRLSTDEVGTLVDSFNGMLAEIERRTQALEESNREQAREVAERTRAEQEVLRLNQELESRVQQRTAQLESANRELEAFCYSVSHDLRAPLRAIDGFSQALIEDFPDSVPEEARRYLGKIRFSAGRMGQLIEDLLNLSKVSRGALERSSVNLSGVAAEVASELQQREPARAVEVSIWEEMVVDGDARLLRVALENLMGNAWKFTARTAKARIEVGALRDGGQATYFVRDNGAGFDMKFVGKLFGAFQRLHQANDYPGTGIGLATVQRIVHRHGGRIWADAQPGKGAVFFFTLTGGS